MASRNKPRKSRERKRRPRQVSGPAQRRRAERHLAEAGRHLEAGNHALAIPALEAAVAADPEHAAAHHHLGLLLHGAGQVERALDLLGRAVQLDTSDAQVRNNLANMLVDCGRPGDAVPLYRAALALNPRYPSALYNLGKALQHLGQPDEAVVQFEAAARLLPDEPQLLASWGAAALEAGDSETALARCEEAVARAPGLAEAHNNLGLVQLALGRFEPSAESFRRALDADAGYGPAAANLTRTRRFSDTADPDIQRIEALLGRASLQPSMELELRFGLGKIYDDLAAFDRAAEHYRLGNALKARQRPFDRQALTRAVDDRIDVFGPAFFEEGEGQGYATNLPVLVIGMPRSGTSLVEQILAAHPEVFGAGELPDLGQMQRRVERLGSQGGRDGWRKLLTADFARRHGQAYEEALRQRADRGSAGASPSSWRRVVDKTPTNFMDLGLAAWMLPGLKVIHCERDPRDCALSIYFRHFTTGHDYAYRLEDIAAFYGEYERLMAHWRTTGMPMDLLDVRYETLVGDLEAQARRIVAFCGLDWDPACLAFHEAERPVYTASTWQVRQPVYQHALNRWRHYPAFTAEFQRARS